MNLYAPVSSIMTSELITVYPKEPLKKVKEIFDNYRIHHLPVVKDKEIQGLISKSDLLFFLKGFKKSKYDELLEETRLNNYLAEEIMTIGLAKLNPDDTVLVALEVFKENLFHAIPIIREDKLVGLVTTLDIIKALSESEMLLKNQDEKE